MSLYELGISIRTLNKYNDPHHHYPREIGTQKDCIHRITRCLCTSQSYEAAAAKLGKEKAVSTYLLIGDFLPEQIRSLHASAGDVVSSIHAAQLPA